ncbi:hypothetical protein BIZ37_04015 [Photobacterium sp. BZF1]|uniref:hypothetical protein n=1 Tax=Photobacterium sp. BZF1 TaxID=1904457 RepID=UPI0016538C44|nr:hypothetical protein [Photobacterium sp. BZF1]MBC7001715.1 hypothetical protein [Photobacterium sp. BZF1]
MSDELELIVKAKARRLGVSVNLLREAIAIKIVDGCDFEEDPIVTVLSITLKDLEQIK